MVGFKAEQTYFCNAQTRISHNYTLLNGDRIQNNIRIFFNNMQALEEDFVEMRKQDSKAMNADSFYVLLTTAR